jgi:hypothetical protein
MVEPLDEIFTWQRVEVQRPDHHTVLGHRCFRQFTQRFPDLAKDVAASTSVDRPATESGKQTICFAELRQRVIEQD